MPYKDPVKQKEAKARIAKTTRLARRQKIHDYKAARGCAVCGEMDPVVLDLHHRDPSEKYKPVAWMISHQRPFEEIMAEAEKCEVLCANCHRRAHFQLRGY